MIYAGAIGNAPGIALGMALSEAILFVTLLIPGSRLLAKESMEPVVAE
jgi:hypothetical protein